MKCERYAVGSSAAGWGGVGCFSVLPCPALLLVVVCLPTCQLFDFPAFRLVGKLESWRGVAGEMASAGGGWRWSGWTVAGQETRGGGGAVYPGVREKDGEGVADTGWDVWPRYGFPCCWMVGGGLPAGAGRWFLGLPRGKRRERGWDV